MVHYQLQIECDVNAKPSIFVNEGVAQAYAEGQYMRGAASPDYLQRFRDLKEANWEDAFIRSMQNRGYFLKHRIHDCLVGLSHAAFWQFLLDEKGPLFLKELFRESAEGKDQRVFLQEYLGRDSVEILKSMRS